MARIEVDRNKCTGLGMCESLAPDVFEVGDDGALDLLTDQAPDDQLDEVREAVGACPTGALTLHEDWSPPAREIASPPTGSGPGRRLW